MIGEDKRHTISGRQANKTAGGLGDLKTRARADSRIERFLCLSLVCRRELGVADRINEEDVRDLEMYLATRVRFHDVLSSSAGRDNMRPEEARSIQNPAFAWKQFRPERREIQGNHNPGKKIKTHR